MIIRREAIEHILKYINDESIIVSTTGMISREIFSTKDRPSNFYMIGSMGLLSSLGLGLAWLNKDKHIYIIEGDGSSLMSLGTLPLITYESPINLTHIILDNEAYELELQDREATIRELRTQLEQKPTVVEAKPALSESKAFKLEIADRMMKLAGLDGVSDITSN